MLAHRSLFVIAGGSCTGKSSILRYGAWHGLPVFGLGNYTLELFAAVHNKEPKEVGNHLSHLRAAEAASRVTDGKVVDLPKLKYLASQPGTQSLLPITFLHLDLSYFFKSEFLDRGSERWPENFNIDFDTDISGTAAVIAEYWQNMLGAVSSNMVRLVDLFDTIVINTVVCSWAEARRRKLRRDQQTGRINKLGRRQHVFNSLYANNYRAEHNYKAHYMGWSMFLDTIPPEKMLSLLTLYHRTTASYSIKGTGIHFEIHRASKPGEKRRKTTPA